MTCDDVQRAIRDELSKVQRAVNASGVRAFQVGVPVTASDIAEFVLDEVNDG